MSSTLKNILQFTGLAIGVPSVQPHLIMVNNLAKVPRLVASNAGGYTITADATNVTVTRLAGGSASVNIYCEAWHSYEDAEPLPNGISSSLFPFVIAGTSTSGGGGSDGIEVVQLDGVTPAVIDPAIATTILQATSPQGACIATLAAGADGFQKRIILDVADNVTSVTIEAGTDLNFVATNGSVGDPSLAGSIELVWSDDLGAWAPCGAAVNFLATGSASNEGGVGTHVVTDGETTTGKGTLDSPIVAVTPAPVLNLYTGDGTDPTPIEVLPTDDTSVLRNSAVIESTQVFNLTAGAQNGHTIQICFQNDTSPNTIQLTVPDLDTGEGGTTITLETPDVRGSIVLVWDADSSWWRVVGEPNTVTIS